ncbi:sulfite exporter TauE/SafE family protein [uncultured Alsobacter sp.]|uniref:sulfite exporter TauE/SafE family protein n=1 Tax=uncultured Alsobacter sp. TaxID=1748258 RepID=UPI0025EFD68E|nr:sulfite exporter TauE/SafE family protein [uncultured Alsobacter sp.]
MALHDWLGLLPSLDRLAEALAVVFAAAALRGFTGFGFAIAAVPLLSLFISPSSAVALALGLQFLGGILDFPAASRDCHWPSLRWLIVGSTIGSPFGVALLSVAPASGARIVIGLLTLVAAILVGGGFGLSAVPGRLWTIAMGLAAGLCNGVAAMPGPAAVAFYMTSPLGRLQVRASLLVFFLATSVAALGSAAAVGLMGRDTVVLSIVALPVMWVGTWCGAQGFHRGDAKLHRRVSVLCLAGIAAASIAKGLSEL